MKLKALIIGCIHSELALAPVPILIRAGFAIDCIFEGFIDLDGLLVVRIPILNNSMATTASELIDRVHYDLIILADDESIGTILDSSLSTEAKEKILPVLDRGNFSHLHTKCGLSEILSKNNITTPPFAICNTPQDLENSALDIGFPVLIKVDRSGGGAGVFECNSYEEVRAGSRNLAFPLLMQKKIEGKTIDLTAFYQKGDLVYFTYSEFLKSVGGKYGPSSVRQYTQIGELPQDVFDQLKDLGRVLGADGFVNATSIECSETNKRYIFEADMRPNTWVDYGRFLGDDAAKRIFNYFSNKKVLSWPQLFIHDFPKTCILSYPRRLSIWQLMFNRYGCWDHFESIKEFYKIFKMRLYSEPTVANAMYLSNRFRSKSYESTYFLHPLFKSITYKNFPYQADLSIRLFLSKNLKPLLPKIIWEYCSALYSRIISFTKSTP